MWVPSMVIPVDPASNFGSPICNSLAALFAGIALLWLIAVAIAAGRAVRMGNRARRFMIE